MNHQRLLERFIRYTAVDTTAAPDSTSYPSSPGQLELGKLIAGELRALKLADVEHDANGIVWATVPDNTVPSNTPSKVDAFALCAHFDTSPETTGKNVKAVVWKNYDGTDLALPGDPRQVLKVSGNPELKNYVGRTLITTDGTTLLGADDKAGLAVIMEAVTHLVENPTLPHGPIRVCFTCDEEIGHGVDHVDPQKLAAVCCYTLDGSAADEIDVETFSADVAIVTFTGVNIHPSIAKGRMVNAVRAAGAFLDQLPRKSLSPETTEKREGFLHPYAIEGGVASATVRVLLRDFDTAKLDGQNELLQTAAAAVLQEFPGVEINLRVTPQYRNPADGLKKEPRAVAYAEQALKNLGRSPKQTIIRGGTDGSRLTELGVPSPNLSTGEHNPHSPLEWTCLEEMAAAVEGLVELAAVWARGGR